MFRIEQYFKSNETFCATKWFENSIMQLQVLIINFIIVLPYTLLNNIPINDYVGNHANWFK